MKTLFFILLTQVIVLFLKKDEKSVKELLNTINYLSSFTLLEPNLSKCEVAGIGALKGVKMEIFGIKWTKEAKILGVFFSNDKNLQLESNFRKTILNIDTILKMWRQRNLKLEGKMIIF